MAVVCSLVLRIMGVIWQFAESISAMFWLVGESYRETLWPQICT